MHGQKGYLAHSYLQQVLATANGMVRLICATDLNLSYPKMIDIAVPANLVCGIQSKASQTF